MEALEFQEVIELLNFSGTTEVTPKPIEGRANGWALHKAVHKVHSATYPFQIIYLYSGAAREDFDAAARHLGRIMTHVVYAPSLDQRQTTHKTLFASAQGVWTTREYLESLINRELQLYLHDLRAQKPTHYIDPRVETPSGAPRRRPNPLLSFLVDREVGFLSGKLGILLAEPGQGKTYMSKFLASQLAMYGHGVLPLSVDSTQWSNMTGLDLASLWKTLAHTFRHHGAPIGWIENHEDEFLRATLKADLFRIVFDGFDEYVLRNAGAVQPMDTLETLAELAEVTGTRIVITSRTSFWDTNLAADAVEKFVERTGTLIYRILPFDAQYAENYFKKRFENKEPRLIAQATQLFRALETASDNLAGRGFILNLLGDIVERGKSQNIASEPAGMGLRWLVQELCDREQLRQQLPFKAEEQLRIFRHFAMDVAFGERPTTELLEFSIEYVRPDVDSAGRKDCLEKLKSHPLLDYCPNLAVWTFKEKQVEIALLAEQLVRWDDQGLRRFIQQVRLGAGEREDMGSMLVTLIAGSPLQEALVTLRRVIRAASRTAPSTVGGQSAISDGQRLAATVALIAVETFVPHGSARRERTQFMLSLCEDGVIEGFVFSGTIGRYDFRGVEFRNCSFEKTTWANCELDETTIFRRCHFVGGAPPVLTNGFGRAVIVESFLDQDATAWLNAERVREGQRRYELEDLKSDFGAVLSKFIIKGGLGLGTVQKRNLTRGTISQSPNRDAIVEALCSYVFEVHHISGHGESGYNVREDAREAMKFYAGNNVYTGPLAEAFDKVKKRLAL